MTKKEIPSWQHIFMGYMDKDLHDELSKRVPVHLGVNFAKSKRDITAYVTADVGKGAVTNLKSYTFERDLPQNVEKYCWYCTTPVITSSGNPRPLCAACLRRDYEEAELYKELSKDLFKEAKPGVCSGAGKVVDTFPQALSLTCPECHMDVAVHPDMILRVGDKYQSVVQLHALGDTSLQEAYALGNVINTGLTPYELGRKEERARCVEICEDIAEGLRTRANSELGSPSKERWRELCAQRGTALIISLYIKDEV